MPNYFSTQRDSIPCLCLRPKQCRFVLLYFHANAEDVGTCASFLGVLAEELDSAVVAPEYPGYGCRTGEASEVGLYQTAEAVYYFITHTLGFPANRVLVMGRSIGGAAATYLMLKTSTLSVSRNNFDPVSGTSPWIKGNDKPFRAAVLLSAFATLAGLADRLLFRGAGLLVGVSFDNLRRITFCTCELLVLHGERDELVPAGDALVLYNAAKNAALRNLFLRETMTHNGFDMVEDIVRPMLATVVDKTLPFCEFKVPDVYFANN